MEFLQVIVSEEPAVTMAEGWSARRDILGQPVYNELKQKIGTIDDVIITLDDRVSFAIIGVGGFLGLAKHDVAISMQQLDWIDDMFVLPGATKEELQTLPKFEYASEDERKPH